ncbi:MAG: hemolysin III family protein, partial [Alistipes sp.]|nr:hemolysin III family protein [Alistipes sp.]
MAKIYIPTFGEEVGNTISHGVMSILMLLALPFAAAYSYSSSGDALLTFGVSLFCVSLFMMFLISTLYHSMLHDTRHKEIFHILDHIFIYVAIAGSYTPVALSV